MSSERKGKWESKSDFFYLWKERRVRKKRYLRPDFNNRKKVKPINIAEWG